MLISRKDRSHPIAAIRAFSSRPLVLLLALFVLIFLFSCGEGSKAPSQHVAIALCDKPEGTFRVAFGSCSRQNKPQGIWQSIAACQPDIWIWLGDAIYAKDGDVFSMAEHYVLQKANLDYQAFAKRTRIIGVWDDHDFGTSQAGKRFAQKNESQKLYLDFIGEPPDSPRRHQEAIYASYVFGDEGRQVKVFLLDVRSDCDDPGPNSDLLGKAQWAWLERELSGSRAQVNLICSGIQILQVDQPYDEWANYGNSRQRLISLIQHSRVPGVILISGDRHLGEISELQGPETNYPLYEVTSSGLTHTVVFWWRLKNLFMDEKNRFRLGHQFTDLNFGTIDISWRTDPVQITIEVHDRLGAVRLRQGVSVLDLQPSPVSR